MLFGRIGRFAQPAFGTIGRTVPQMKPVAPWGVVGARNFSMPKTLSVRMDGLFAQCMIAAVIYFVPQDVVFLGGVLWMTHSAASASSPCTKVKDVDAAVEDFKAKKGLEKVSVSKGRTSYVEL